MLGHLSLDIICSSKLTVFLELRSRKTVRFSEQIMSADKYPSIFSRQMKAIVYIKQKHIQAKHIWEQISDEVVDDGHIVEVSRRFFLKWYYDQNLVEYMTSSLD